MTDFLGPLGSQERAKVDWSEVIRKLALLGLVGSTIYIAARCPIAVAPKVPSDDERAAQVLGVQPNASIDEIRSAFRKRLFEVHPDRGGDEEATRRLVDARDRLLRRAGT
jgi:CysZ protein